MQIVCKSYNALYANPTTQAGKNLSVTNDAWWYNLRYNLQPQRYYSKHKPDVFRELEELVLNNFELCGRILDVIFSQFTATRK